MPGKSIGALRSKKKESATITDKEIRRLAEAAQQALAGGEYENALEQSVKLSSALADDAKTVSVYLTSLVWQVSALQGLKKCREDIENVAVRYRDEAKRLGDMARVVQAERIIAQGYIDEGQWMASVEHLEAALTQSIENQQGRETLEILMHLSALELKMCHYVEAIDYLSRAMNAIRGSGADNEDIRELSAVGNRQLCELYHTIGEGQSACDALEAAQNAHTHDPEELWMQEILLSRLDLRSGDADSACVRLKKVEQEIRKGVENGKIRAEQLAMVSLERAQAMWAHGEYAQARTHLAQIEVLPEWLPLREAVALTSFQWAVEMGRPMAEPDEAGGKFSEICGETDNTDVQIVLAAALTQAALEIERGHYIPTLESLQHIAQTAAFTQLIPFATRALALRGQIFMAQKSWEAAAQDGKDACEMFVCHVDDVSAKQAAAMMLNAQLENAHAAGDYSADESELAAIAQLKQDFERYESHHHVEAVIDLGIQLAKIYEKIGDRTASLLVLDRVDAHLVPEYMAPRMMSFKRLKARLTGDEQLEREAAQIAQLNDYR